MRRFLTTIEGPTNLRTSEGEDYPVNVEGVAPGGLAATTFVSTSPVGPTGVVDFTNTFTTKTGTFLLIGTIAVDGVGGSGTAGDDIAITLLSGGVPLPVGGTIGTTLDSKTRASGSLSFVVAGLAPGASIGIGIRATDSTGGHTIEIPTGFGTLTAVDLVTT